MLLDLERQVAVAQLKAQPSHFLHRVDVRLDERGGRDLHHIAFAVLFGDHIARVQRHADADAQLGAVRRRLGDALFFGFKPRKLHGHNLARRMLRVHISQNFICNHRFVSSLE